MNPALDSVYAAVRARVSLSEPLGRGRTRMWFLRLEPKGGAVDVALRAHYSSGRVLTPDPRAIRFRVPARDVFEPEAYVTLKLAEVLS